MHIEAPSCGFSFQYVSFCRSVNNIVFWNMSNYISKKHHRREVLLFFSNSKKSDAESHRLLSETYGDYTRSTKTCEYWFRRFQNDDLDTEDKERLGHPKMIEDEELETLLNKDPCQTQYELSESLGVDCSTISRRLHALGMIQKQGNRVPYELKPRNVDFSGCQRSAQCCKTGENLLGNA